MESSLWHMGSSVFIVTSRIFFFSCSMQVLVTRQRVEPGPLALGMWSFSHWTTREVHLASFLISAIPNFYLTRLLGKLTGLTFAKCPHPGWK